jgi:quinoprotein glucose dehydrogenase
MLTVPMKTLCVTAAGVSLAWLALDATSQPSSQSNRTGVSVSNAATYAGWTHYGGSPDQVRYSSLRQIDKTNVSRLAVAWTYDAGEAGGLQTQPIVEGDVLFGYTPTHKTFALRAATGELLWTFDPKIEERGANRGLMYWSSGDDRRVFAAVDQYLYALDARTGQPIPAFGEKGRIDLRVGLGRDPQTQSVRLTTPGVIFKDTLIIGGRVSEGLPASPGDIRAYDVKSGKLKWAFHTIPHPGESGYETWSKDSWTINGGANSWPGMALDERRGIVYIPTGSAAADFYGANRLGDNLYANCLLAMNAETGERIWSFQFVRHDVWDRDPPAPPGLVTLRRNGRTVDAVVQTTKHGYVFVFDRTNGQPLFPIEYRTFPPSAVPGEVTADTQPIPLAPKPFARQVLNESLLTTRTPEAHQWAVEQLRTFQNGGLFVPLTVDRQTVIFPGFDGGAEWGGSAIDPTTGVLYVNANDIAWTGSLAPSDPRGGGRAVYLQQCASCHRDDRAGTPPSIPSLVDIGTRRTRTEIETIIQRGGGRMPGFPSLEPESTRVLVDYLLGGNPSGDAAAPLRPAAGPSELPYRFTGYQKFLDPDGYPAVAPPWGTLSAIDLNTGNYAWQIPLGEYPELAEKGMKNTGTENYGGPIVTAGGVLFIGATNFDRKFRAFDKATGKLLWETTLPFSGNATPATYQVGGRQFVVIAAGGGKGRRNEPSGGTYVAFALPVKSDR